MLISRFCSACIFLENRIIKHITLQLQGVVSTLISLLPRLTADADNTDMLRECLLALRVCHEFAYSPNQTPSWVSPIQQSDFASSLAAILESAVCCGKVRPRE